MYKHILISTDGSEVAQKGVDHGLSLAKSLGAQVTVITVTEPFPYHAAASSVGWTPLPIDISGYEEGQNEAIVETARTQGCSLIVMSSHGRRGLAGCCWEARPRKCLSIAPCPSSSFAEAER